MQELRYNARNPPGIRIIYIDKNAGREGPAFQRNRLISWP